MTEVNYSYHNTTGVPLKLWDSHQPFDENAMEQLKNVASLKFVYNHVAGMPDVHLGYGATVGSVIATKGAIIPAAVGVDIGCGMMAVRTNLTAHILPDNLYNVRCAIEAAIPHGRTDNGGASDRGSWSTTPDGIERTWVNALNHQYQDITIKHPGAKSTNAMRQLGTLGTGNHFIEICLDDDDDVWLMLHSGSRGAGNRIGTYFIRRAKEEMKRWHIDQYLPDQDLAYLVEHTELFDDYVQAVEWAQIYAAINRRIMMERVLTVLREWWPGITADSEQAVNCHHNYVAREHHFGKNVIVTRKGAVRARKGDLGIIPGSMGTGSFIVEGKGNPDSFHSCSHGAGRVMSRTAAKKLISLADHKKAVEGIECRTDEGVLDESPAAYKDITAVMKAQDDLVEIKYHLRQIVNVKG